MKTYWPVLTSENHSCDACEKETQTCIYCGCCAKCCESHSIYQKCVIYSEGFRHGFDRAEQLQLQPNKEPSK